MKFQLKADKKVMANLDSVFFSIDLEKGLIYNADSLPVGTPISRLIPVITYADYVTEALLTVTDAENKSTEIDYLKNPSDSIDFNNKVTLRLTAQNGTSSKLYELKVNVHKLKPDSLSWSDMQQAKLPSRLSSPRNQKSISAFDKVCSLIEESDGSYTLATTKAPDKAQWDKQKLDLAFVPDLRSFNASQDKFYLLDAGGSLYESADGMAWSDTGCDWYSIVGGYDKAVQGIRIADGGTYVHTQYPVTAAFTDYAVEADFPIKDMSAMGTYTNKWSLLPLGLIMGGTTASGELCGTTWAFDGTDWANISNTGVPPVKQGTLLPYYAFMKHSTMWRVDEFSIWVFFGGELANGKLSRTVYISYNNGVTWTEAPETMALPAFIPSMRQADFAVVDTRYNSNFEPKAWKRFSTPADNHDYVIDGYEISWNCPYIYLFGGRNEQGALCNTIWKGCINRLSFRPIF